MMKNGWARVKPVKASLGNMGARNDDRKPLKTARDKEELALFLSVGQSAVFCITNPMTLAFEVH